MVLVIEVPLFVALDGVVVAAATADLTPVARRPVGRPAQGVPLGGGETGAQVLTPARRRDQLDG